MTNTIALPQSIFKRLEKLSASSKRSTSSIVKQALQDRLDYEEWALKQIDAGLADIKAGRTIPHDEFWKRIEAVNARKKAA